MVGIGLGFAISSYVVLSFVLTFLQKVVGVPAIPAYLTVVVATLFGAALIPLFGWLSDKYGRKPVLVAACLASIVLPVLGFFVVITGSLPAVMIGQLLMWIPVSIFAGVTPSRTPRCFRPRFASQDLGLHMPSPQHSSAGPPHSSLLSW